MECKLVICVSKLVVCVPFTLLCSRVRHCVHWQTYLCFYRQCIHSYFYQLTIPLPHASTPVLFPVSPSLPNPTYPPVSISPRLHVSTSPCHAPLHTTVHTYKRRFGSHSVRLLLHMKRLTGIETRYCQIDADSLGAQGIAQCFDILTPVSNLEITHVSYSDSNSDISGSSGGDGGGSRGGSGDGGGSGGGGGGSGGGGYKALANVIVLQVRRSSIT